MRTHLSPPMSRFIKENPCGKECAVLRILSPWSKGPAKFYKQRSPETTTGIGGGNAPYRVANPKEEEHSGYLTYIAHITSDYFITYLFIIYLLIKSTHYEI